MHLAVGIKVLQEIQKPEKGLFVLQRLLAANREFFAAISSPVCQHPASVGGRHSLTKSVLILSFST
jgi:hypothetical protein